MGVEREVHLVLIRSSLEDPELMYKAIDAYVHESQSFRFLAFHCRHVLMKGSVPGAF
jgi:hypothetical protein